MSESNGRKPRSDKGMPRRSTMQDWYDRFADLDLAAQLTAIEVLTEINRQARRGRIPVAQPAQEALPDV